jgi:hypothetical protein
MVIEEDDEVNITLEDETAHVIGKKQELNSLRHKCK